jgi:hypothetical protein
MWMFTKIGFFSAVQSKDDENTIVVRARLEQDIERLADFLGECQIPQPKVIKTPHRDYLYRVMVKREDWKKAVARLADEIDYTNFKNEVHDGTHRDAAYSRVWSVMYAIQ